MKLSQKQICEIAILSLYSEFTSNEFYETFEIYPEDSLECINHIFETWFERYVK